MTPERLAMLRRYSGANGYPAMVRDLLAEVDRLRVEVDRLHGEVARLAQIQWEKSEQLYGRHQLPEEG